MLTGGGSGGHITPVLAVAHELKRLAPDSELTYIGQTGDDLLDIVENSKAIDRTETIYAGKLRRYSGEGWRQLLDFKTQALNIRDMYRTIRGTLQAYRMLGKLRPAVIFTRGGYVSVPVAFAACLRHIPYITHDADSVPSLANRLIAKRAVHHAVALPVSNYPYDPEKTTQVGMPTGADYKPVTKRMLKQYREELGLDGYKQVVLVTGGGNGARFLNEVIVANSKYLLATYPNLVLLHFAGRALVDETIAAYDALGLGRARSRVLVYGFETGLFRFSGAADVVIGRGGMSSLTEFALQHRACVVVPSKQLGWNVKNSHILAGQGAIIELTEAQSEQPERLGRTIGELLDDESRRHNLGERLSNIASSSAAHDLATMILKSGAGERGK